MINHLTCCLFFNSFFSSLFFYRAVGFYCFCLGLMPHVRTHMADAGAKRLISYSRRLPVSAQRLTLCFNFQSSFFFLSLHHMRRCSISVTCRNGRKASPANHISEWDRPLFPPPFSMPTDAVKHIYYWHGRGTTRRALLATTGHLCFFL